MNLIERQTLEDEVVDAVAALGAWLEKMKQGWEYDTEAARTRASAGSKIRASHIVRCFHGLHEYVLSAVWRQEQYGHLTDVVQDAGEFIEVLRAYRRATGQGADSASPAEQIFERAHVRCCYDEDWGDLTVREVALLANMTEQSVRNAMVAGAIKPHMKNGEQVFTPASLRAWLPARRGFRRPAPQLETPASATRHSRQATLMVPMAADGSLFHPGLQRRLGFAIGKKGEERYVKDYDEALAILTKMAPPYWRRPSPKSGVPGIVKGVGWKELTRAELELYAGAQARKGK